MADFREKLREAMEIKKGKHDARVEEYRELLYKDKGYDFLLKIADEKNRRFFIGLILGFFIAFIVMVNM